MKNRDLIIKRIQGSDRERNRDRIRGSIIGGAVGDALGYPIEFLSEPLIFELYGESGITEYDLNRETGKAQISDDTQMTLFTANGYLFAETRCRFHQGLAPLRNYIARAYLEWLRTQEEEYGYVEMGDWPEKICWLSDIPELYAQRAPGITCTSSLRFLRQEKLNPRDFMKVVQNNSKGCGGVMRVAPIAFAEWFDSLLDMDMEAAQIAAITHSHALGYMSAAVLVHIIHRIVYSHDMSLLDCVMEACDTVRELFLGYPHLQELIDIINLALELSQNEADDLENIHTIGKGWVAEEALAIAIYCSLKYQDNFSKGIIAAVNHEGDSDSTGSITGNILGALLGYDAIDDKWKKDIELFDVILEIADDLATGCPIDEYSEKDIDKELVTNWVRKYLYTCGKPLSEEDFRKFYPRQCDKLYRLRYKNL